MLLSLLEAHYNKTNVKCDVLMSPQSLQPHVVQHQASTDSLTSHLGRSGHESAQLMMDSLETGLALLHV